MILGIGVFFAGMFLDPIYKDIGIRLPVTTSFLVGYAMWISLALSVLGVFCIACSRWVEAVAWMHVVLLIALGGGIALSFVLPLLAEVGGGVR